jgi:hypothetical protein
VQDPAFYVNSDPDPDPALKMNADPCESMRIQVYDKN